MSSADLAVLRFVPEVTIGVTPATPALQQIRYTSESLNYAIENTQTAEVRPDRAQTDLVQVSAQGAGEINFELSFDSFKEFLAAALCSTWGAPVSGVETLQNGILRPSFTIQKHFQDMTPQQYHNYRGVCIDGFKFSTEVGKIVEGSFSLLAFGAVATPTQITGATFPAPDTTTPFNAVTNLQDFTIDSVPFSGCIMSLSMDLKNQLRAIMCLGSITPRDMKLGELDLTGEMNFYFNEASNYALFINGSEFAFQFKLQDADGNSYTFRIPRAKFETGEVVAGGKNTDVMFTATWRALLDSVTGAVILIDSEAGP